jgi:hypothetical protein
VQRIIQDWQPFRVFSIQFETGPVGELIENSLILCGAVNLVSRIKAIAKSLDLPLIVSDDFAHAYGER